MSVHAFNFAAFKATFSAAPRPELVYMARTAEAAERYDDMCAFMKELVMSTYAAKEDLTVDERNLLSVAFKNALGSRRNPIRALAAQETSKESEQRLVDLYRKQVETELDSICKEVLSLLENNLIPTSEKSTAGDKDEAAVFYLKMTGDYYRYLAEFTDQQVEAKAGDYYNRALQIAEAKLDPTHPIRLGLALNYSVCFYEILKDKKKACDLAKSAFDSAMQKLDKLSDAASTESYKDSTLIMQLLRDNLILWTSSPDDVDVQDFDGNE